MRYLLIDDMREFGKQIPMPPEGSEWSHALTYDSALFELKIGGPWDVVYLDHDLGEPEPNNGYSLLNWIEEQAQDETTKQFFVPKKIILVTSNPVGRRKMQAILDKLYPKEQS